MVKSDTPIYRIATNNNTVCIQNTNDRDFYGMEENPRVIVWGTINKHKECTYLQV